MKEFLKGAERDIQAAMLKCFLVVCLIIISIGCGSGRDMDDPKNRQEFEQLQELVSSREFEIENEWAIPMTGNMVNLMGNTNFIRFKRDSVDLFLPYFGVGILVGLMNGKAESGTKDLLKI